MGCGLVENTMNDTLNKLAEVLEARKSAPAESSYVAGLYAGGLDAVLAKVDEEAAEVIAAAREDDAKALVKAGIDILGHSVRDQPVDDELIALMKKNGTHYAATITREQSTYIYHSSPEWLDDPFFRKSVSDDVVEGVRTQLKQAQSAPAVIEQGQKDFEMAMKNAKTLVDAGVNVAFGTDTGPPGRFAGFFEHWEAELMAEAGISPMRIIQAWSRDSSEALGIEKDFGTLERGKVADLVVLDANPLDEIRNTRKIHAVYMSGKKFE